ncbi:SDR family oxidoreductase [Amycolatopsis acidicola]|uniref:SDR family oxidoreductase n=1 Tax=Amycolatopsis acidicola TaxID=2596893 RepID=A0A5N0UYX7_9PSEU|nr:SDR family oxidoreductase [Amycolatopsis acidicola]KAA9156348.1 SDR family oxidoreductase [Amycolatopsis acidicola]
MHDRTALVTGANKGIGRHIAAQLAAEGFTVLVGSRDRERGELAAKEIGGNARLLVLDVTDPAGIAEAASAVESLDVLVNNAGINISLAPAPETAPEDLRRMFETNVFGLAAVTNAFLPALLRSPHPRIVNVSSGTASLEWSANPEGRFVVSPDGAAGYRASKAAVNSLTVLYAQTLADKGVKVNALAPGARATELTAWNPESAARMAQAGDPAEAARGAVHLALLPDDGPTGGFFSWDGTVVPW